MRPFSYLFAAAAAVSLSSVSIAAAPVDPSIINEFAKPHQLVRLEDGRRINLFCMGSGDRTVLFDAGGSDWSVVWALVQPVIASKAKACSYDRAGLGYSDSSPAPRTPVSIVDDAHALISTALKGPVILVGHSLGGFHAKLHAALYPNDVEGLVLVDPAEDRWWDRTRASHSQEIWRETCGALGAARRILLRQARGALPGLRHRGAHGGPRSEIHGLPALQRPTAPAAWGRDCNRTRAPAGQGNLPRSASFRDREQCLCRQGRRRGLLGSLQARRRRIEARNRTHPRAIRCKRPCRQSWSVSKPGPAPSDCRTLIEGGSARRAGHGPLYRIGRSGRGHLGDRRSTFRGGQGCATDPSKERLRRPLRSDRPLSARLSSVIAQSRDSC